MKCQSTRLITTLALLSVTLGLVAPCAFAQEGSEPLFLQEGRLLSEGSLLQQATRQPRNISALSWEEALPEAAQKMIAQLFENPYDEISQNRTRQFIGRLQMMQDTYTRSNRLEEASAIRNAIDEIKTRSSGVLPDPGNLTAFRGQNNRSINFEVTGRNTGSVWGTGVYTDDSNLGTAAVHAGLLRVGQKGFVKVTILPGNFHYDGSSQNEVTSSNYETWEGSYSIAAGRPPTPVFVDKSGKEETRKTEEEALPEEARKILDLFNPLPPAGNNDQILSAIQSLQTLQATNAKEGKLDEAIAIHNRTWKIIVALVGAQSFTGNLHGYRGQVGQNYLFEVTGHKTGSVWGTGVYTDDSDLGTAAVHAGLLRPGQRGIVRVTILPGNVRYTDSTRNGVTSNPYATFQGSFRVEGVNILQILSSRQ